MKLSLSLLALVPAFMVASCEKNTMSKIPQISLNSFMGDSVRAGSPFDTITIAIKFADGDADLGVDPNNTNGYYDIYLKDSRYDTGYVGYFLPAIDGSAENSAKGITGILTFKQPAALLQPRQDSAHIKFGDTLSYEIYIADRARHESNHIVTPAFIIRP